MILSDGFERSVSDRRIRKRKCLCGGSVERPWPRRESEKCFLCLSPERRRKEHLQKKFENGPLVIFILSRG